MVWTTLWLLLILGVILVCVGAGPHWGLIA